jgi:thiamine biosynthesis lipoprotein
MATITRPTQTRTEAFLGQHVRIDVRDNAHADLVTMALRSAWAEFLRIDRRFSRLRDDSDITLLSMHEARREDLADEVNAVLDACTAMSLVTRGAFDISRGCDDEQIDVAGYVKGWAMDRVAAVLREHGMTHFCLAIGMDVLVSGRAADDRPWRAGVRDGRPGQPVRAVITLDRQQPYRAISTVADPHGRGGTTTVVAQHAVQASALAIAAAEWGERGTPWIAMDPGVDVLRISASGELSGSRGMSALLHW